MCLRGAHTGYGCALGPMIACLLEGCMKIQTQREGRKPWMMEAEVGVRQLQAKDTEDCHQPPEARGEARIDCSLSLEGTSPVLILDSSLPESRENTFLLF